MSQNPVDAQINSAWASHRAGKHEQAVREFHKVIDNDPDHIDALYGLALAQRANGQRADALKNFTACLAQVNQGLAKDPGSDRFEILQRMVTQRIAELQAQVT